ncbi:MAG: YeeE/YedE family protein [Gemmatimonadales bacterium]|nr:YeeE/YedE family protein [Gemmatimonadales bacterium]
MSLFESLLDRLLAPWPWYVAGPMIGAMVPVLLILGNKQFGFSSNLRNLCAAALPTSRAAYLRYDWRASGGWNLAFLVGTMLGGFIAAQYLGSGDVAIAPATRDALAALGITDFSGLVPAELFDTSVMFGARSFLILLVGGFLVGFGTQWAGGCSSGHGVAGLANFELASLIAVCGFFAGGLIGTHLLLPLVLGGGA